MLLLIEEDTHVSVKFFPNLLKTRDCKHTLALLCFSSLVGLMLFFKMTRQKGRCWVPGVTYSGYPQLQPSASGDPGELRAEAWGGGKWKKEVMQVPAAILVVITACSRSCSRLSSHVAGWSSVCDV